MTNDTNKPPVAAIGLGEMGAALARALLAGGYRTTVWNRSATKCAPIAQQGAKVAASVLEAVTASEVIFVCVSDYEAVRRLLHEPAVAAALRGKTVVQLTTRTPGEARTGEAWFREAGAACLEGAIQGYPTHIGTTEGAILYAGPRAAFDRVESILKCLTERAVFISERIGSAAALDLAMAGTVVPGVTLAFLQGAAICDAEGAPLSTYLELVERSLLPGLVLSTMHTSVDQIGKGAYAYEGAGAPIDAWLGGLEMVVKAVRDAGVNPSWSEQVLGYLRRAVADGHGQSELAVIYEYFRRGTAPKADRSTD